MSDCCNSHKKEHTCACDAFDQPQDKTCDCGCDCSNSHNSGATNTHSSHLRHDGIRIILALVLYIPSFFIPWAHIGDTSHALLAQFIYLLVPYLIIGHDVIRNAFTSIVHGRIFSESFLMTIATFGAFALVLFPDGNEHMKEAVAIMLFYQIGEWFERLAVERSRASVTSLMNLTPDIVTKIEEDTEHPCEAAQLIPGDTILIRPGERLAVDAILLSEHATIDASALTGEHIPASIAKGEHISAGSIAVETPILARVEHPVHESAIARILHMVEDSSARKAKTEHLIRRFAKYYTPLVTISAILVAILGPLVTGDTWTLWLERALMFLVVSCPCAFVVSVPLTFFAGIGGASKAGILIKGGNYMEALARVDAIAFDKTGTLTTGEFKMSHIRPHNDTDQEACDALVHIAGSAEQHSTHPIAKHLQAQHENLHKDCTTSATNIKEIAGHGLQATIDNKHVLVGNEALFTKHNITIPACNCNGTMTHVAADGVYFGHITFEEDIRAHATHAISEIQKLGIPTLALLTGDNKNAAHRVAQALGITHVYPHLLPEEKVSALSKLKENSTHVAFVGDGINDAPVLAASDVGIAMGGLASDAALEAADIVLVDGDIEKLPLAIRISRKTIRIAKQNIAFAVGVKLIIMMLSIAGLSNLWLAVFGDVGVTVLAILHALRAFTARSQ